LVIRFCSSKALIVIYCRLSCSSPGTRRWFKFKFNNGALCRLSITLSDFRHTPYRGMARFDPVCIFSFWTNAPLTAKSQFDVTVPHIAYAALGGFVVLVCLDMNFWWAALTRNSAVRDVLPPVARETLHRRGLLGVSVRSRHWCVAMKEGMHRQG
jgi:hypothetical protein